MEKACVCCAAPIDWGRLCDVCVEAEKLRRLAAPPDVRRCRHCGAFKSAPGHSEYVCSKRAERGEL